MTVFLHVALSRAICLQCYRPCDDIQIFDFRFECHSTFRERYRGTATVVLCDAIIRIYIYIHYGNIGQCTHRLR